MSFVLPPLPFAMDALEPYMDARTVEIHYTKHHQTYLNNLNAALAKHPELESSSIEDLLRFPDAIPEDIRTAVINNGGGYFNHNIFWANLRPPGGSEPKGSLEKAILSEFGSVTSFKEQFEKAGLGRFGSGYAWLSMKSDGKLIIHTSANQDSPLWEGLHILLVVDVWEHAYYLKYQNRRAEYLSNWWNIVNWEEVERRYAS
jgi:Fe-Mn family superoxide dismutase